MVINLASVFIFLTMKSTIPIHLIKLEDGNYHLTLESVFQNGMKGLWIIDTGASKTVFDQMLNNLYETILPDENVLIQSAGIGEGMLCTSLGKLISFKLSDFEVEPFQVALIDLTHINKVYFNVTEKQICGLLGGDFLLRYKAIIDYKKLKLTLRF